MAPKLLFKLLLTAFTKLIAAIITIVAKEENKQYSCKNYKPFAIVVKEISAEESIITITAAAEDNN